MDIIEALSNISPILAEAGYAESNLLNHRFHNDGHTVYLMNPDILKYGCDRESVFEYIGSTLKDDIAPRTDLWNSRFVAHLMIELLPRSSQRILVLDTSKNSARSLESDSFLKDRFERIVSGPMMEDLLEPEGGGFENYEFLVSFGCSLQLIQTMFQSSLPRCGVVFTTIEDFVPDQIASLHPNKISLNIQFGDGPTQAVFWGLEGKRA